MGLAGKVISLTFRSNINLHMFRDEFVEKKKRFFDERSARSKAVLDDSSIAVDTTSHQRASKLHELHNSRVALSTLFL